MLPKIKLSRKWLDRFAALFIAGWAARNVIALIATIPVFAEMIEMGGTPMAIWIAFCGLAGIALSVLVPWIAYRKIRAKFS